MKTIIVLSRFFNPDIYILSWNFHKMNYPETCQLLDGISSTVNIMCIHIILYRLTKCELDHWLSSTGHDAIIKIKR